MNFLKIPFQFLSKNKGRIFLYFIFVIVFLFVLFPFNDFGDLVSAQVSKLTNNQFFIGFDQMKISAYPNPGVELNQVVVETPFLPSLSAQRITVLPSAQGLITQRPYGKVSIAGFLNGNINLHVGKGPKTEKGAERLKLDLKVQKISLQEVRQLAHLPVAIKGQLNIDSQILADLAMTEAPEINDLNLLVDQFELLPSSLDLNGLSVSIPAIKLAQAELKGRLSEGQFYIESANLGRPSDELSGQLKGKIQMTVINTPQGPSVVPGAYDLSLSLKVKKSFRDLIQISEILMSFGDYGRFFNTTPDGIEFKARITGASFGLLPQMSTLQ